MAKSSKVKLPEWAAEDGKNAVRVDPDKFYPGHSVIATSKYRK